MGPRALCAVRPRSWRPAAKRSCATVAAAPTMILLGASRGQHLLDVSEHLLTSHFGTVHSRYLGDVDLGPSRRNVPGMPKKYSYGPIKSQPSMLCTTITGYLVWVWPAADANTGTRDKASSSMPTHLASSLSISPVLSNLLCVGTGELAYVKIVDSTRKIAPRDV